jgi:hypothetical protein
MSKLHVTSDAEIMLVIPANLKVEGTFRRILLLIQGYPIFILDIFEKMILYCMCIYQWV